MHIIPADQEWFSRTLISEIVTRRIESMGIQHPKPTEEAMKPLEEAKRRLMDG